MWIITPTEYYELDLGPEPERTYRMVKPKRTQRNLVQLLEWAAEDKDRWQFTWFGKRYWLWHHVNAFINKFNPHADWVIACQSAAEFVKTNVYGDK